MIHTNFTLFHLHKVHNSDIALELFGTLGVGGGRELSARAKKILKHCTNRSDVLLKMIELCPNPTLPKELYIVSTAYVWLGAGYRKEAITYLQKYLSVGGIWEGTPNQTLYTWGYPENQLELNRATVFHYLGSCYEGEYLFDEAISAYESAYRLHPYSATDLICMAKAYIKKNDLDQALEILYKAKSSKYYVKHISKNILGEQYENTDFIKLIDSTISDTEAKKLRGYKYRPRKSK